MKRMKAASIAALAVVAALAFSCAHKAHYDPATGIIKKDGAVYHAGLVPEGWHQVSPRGGDVAMMNDALLAVIATDSQCPFSGDPPLRSLFSHLLIGFTDRTIISEEVLQLDKRDAYRAVYIAKLDGVAQKYMVYILKKNSCVFDLIYYAPERTFSEGLPRFEEFVKAFGTVQ
ncbi:MAG: hypothetical protein WC889_15910 [Myxococcota bacterium]|jgi:hypothetical protein